MNQCKIKFVCESERCKYKEYEKGYEGLRCTYKSKWDNLYYCQNEKAIIEAVKAEIEKRS